MTHECKALEQAKFCGRRHTKKQKVGTRCRLPCLTTSALDSASPWSTDRYQGPLEAQGLYHFPIFSWESSAWFNDTTGPLHPVTTVWHILHGDLHARSKKGGHPDEVQQTQDSTLAKTSCTSAGHHCRTRDANLYSSTAARNVSLRSFRSLMTNSPMPASGTCIGTGPFSCPMLKTTFPRTATG